MSSLLPLLSLHAALAAPAVDVDGPRVRGVVVVDAPVDALRTLVRDPDALALAVGRQVRLVPLSSAGGCTRYAMTLASPLGPQRGTIEACDTASGSEVHLVESPDFARYDYRWEVEAGGGGGARVVHTLDLAPALPLPSIFVRRLCAREVDKMLAALDSWTGEQPW